MSDTGDDLRAPHNPRRLLRKEESASKTGEESGSSSTDDYGLRRRFVSSHASGRSEVGLEIITQRKTEPTVSDVETIETPNVGQLQLGAESRKIVDPENPDRDQPLMSKKKKKKKKSLGSRQTHPTLKSDIREKLGKKYTKFTRSDVGFFTSGDDVRDPRHDSYVIFVLRDFVIYLIFMVITSIAIFGSYGTADNYFANVLADLVVKSKFVNKYNIEKTFYDITHRRDMWSFLNNIIVGVLYESRMFSNRPFLPIIYGGLSVNVENVLFGAPQIRQVRVKGDTCQPAPLFKGAFDDCADYYSEETEDRRAFGMNNSAWIYKPATQDHLPLRGFFSTYGGGGFSMNIGRSQNLTKTWFQELEQQRWIRFGTRAVILDFNLLNQNTHLFCAAKLLFEMPPTGGIVAQAYFTTVKLVWYSGSWGFFQLSCHLAFVAFIIFYTYEEISQMVRLKLVYFWNCWNILDVIILVCSYITIIFAVISIVSSNNFLMRHRHVLRTYEHASFDYMVLLQTRYRIAEAILAFFVWVKILKFSTLNRTVCLVLTAFGKVRSELIAATILMAILLFGFALLGLCVAGHIFKQLSSIGPAMFTLVGLLGGGIHFYFAHKLNEFAFRTWLLLYIIACIVIFINIYVALIVHGFELAQTEIDDLSETAQLSDIGREFFCQFLLCFRKRHIVSKIREREIEKQNIRIFRQLANIISRHSFDSREIGLIFRKHDVHYGKDIPVETMSAIYEELNVRNQLFVETEGHNQITEQLEKLSRSVEQVDQTVMSVMTKVDTLTNKYLTDNVKK